MCKKEYEAYSPSIWEESGQVAPRPVSANLIYTALDISRQSTPPSPNPKEKACINYQIHNILELFLQVPGQLQVVLYFQRDQEFPKAKPQSL